MCLCVTTSVVWKLIMAIAISAVIVIGLLNVQRSTSLDTPCPDGRLCPANWTCCEQGCCVPTTPHSRSADIFKDHGFLDNPWYTQWPVLFFLGILGGILFCCTWFCICKRYTSSPDGVLAISCACCINPLRTNDEIDSAGSLYPPPHYSRCGSFHQAPPPYSEVQSKPDLYPLVITCADGEGKAGGNYVMVQYFRNYVIRPAPGSLSATSTAESLNSSFICNASNEANTIVPPPYSCATNFEEFGMGRSMLRSMSLMGPSMEARAPGPEPLPPRPPPRSRPDIALITPVRQRNTTNLRENLLHDNLLLDDEDLRSSVERLDLELFDCPDVNCKHVCKPKTQTSPYQHQLPASTENPLFEGYGHRPVMQSPPLGYETPRQPTSPTVAQQCNETVRKSVDERRQRRLTESLKRNIRKSSLYMPLTTAHPAKPSRMSLGARASSRSAPATPCSNLVPSILNLTQRVSASRNSSRSSRLEEEYDPLLTDFEQIRTDYKF